MTDSISIPLDLLTETRAALDAALLVSESSPETYGKVIKVRAKLDGVMSEKSLESAPKSDTIQRRSEALERKARNIVAIAEDMARQLRELKAA